MRKMPDRVRAGKCAALTHIRMQYIESYDTYTHAHATGWAGADDAVCNGAAAVASAAFAA